MEPNSLHNQDEIHNDISKLLCQIRELYGRVTYTHKVHEKCADIYFSQSNSIKVLQIALAALTTGSLILAIFGEGKVGTIVGAFLSTLLFALNAYVKDHDLGGLSQKHIAVASQLWDIRESYLSLLIDLSENQISSKKARKLRDDLQEKQAHTLNNSPRTTEKAFKKAQEALKINEEMTFSDEEIDKLLPVALRICEGEEN